jgi:hypothetical protein
MDEKSRVGPERDFVLGIATSGTTPYVHGALDRARERGARTGFLLCTHPRPPMSDRYDVVIAPLVGPEVVTGSTRMKAGTATKLVLNTISTGAMIRLGKVFGNLMVDLRATNEKLRDRSERILMEMCELDRATGARAPAPAGGSVKTAIAMYWTGSEPEEAQRLSEAGGRLGEILAMQPNPGMIDAFIPVASSPFAPLGGRVGGSADRMELMARALRFRAGGPRPRAPAVVSILDDMWSASGRRGRAGRLDWAPGVRRRRATWYPTDLDERRPKRGSLRSPVFGPATLRWFSVVAWRSGSGGGSGDGAGPR